MQQIKLIAVNEEQFRERIREAFTTVKAQGIDKPVQIVIEPQKRKRSNPQNNRLWKIHAQAASFISRNTGKKWNSEDMHEMFKQLFCDPDFVEINGKNVYRGKSSTELSTAEMSEAQEKYIAYLQVDLGIPIEI